MDPPQLAALLAPGDHDLRAYAAAIDQDLAAAEAELADAYRRSCDDDRVAALLERAKEASAHLDTAAASLGDVLDALRRANHGIEALKQRMQALSAKVANRITAELALAKLLPDVLLTPATIHTLIQGRMDDGFIGAMTTLDRQADFVVRKLTKKTRVFKDVAPELEKLCLITCRHIHQSLLERIRSLKAPGANVHMTQNVILLRMAPTYAFLARWHGDAAEHVCQEYIATIKGFYTQSFRLYLQRLGEYETTLAKRNDLIFTLEGKSLAHATAAHKLLVALGETRERPADGSVFGLASRIKPMVGQPDDTLSLSALQKSSARCSSEAVFKSFIVALMDNVSAEYCFLEDFFLVEAADEMSHLFSQIFSSVLQTSLNHFKLSVSSSFDAVSLGVCARVVELVQHELQRREIPVLKVYLASCNDLVQQRLAVLLKRYCDNAQQLLEARGLVLQATAANMVTKRLGTFVATMLAVDAGQGTKYYALDHLTAVEDVYVDLMRRYTATSDPQSGSVALINNFDEFCERLRLTGANGITHIERFQGLVSQAMAEFATHAVQEGFPMLRAGLDACDESRIKEHISAFNATWRRSIASANSTSMQQFASVRLGSRALQAYFSTLVHDYERFVRQVHERWPALMASTHDAPVDVEMILVEIKKFRPLLAS